MIDGREFKELLAFLCVNYSINVLLGSRNSPAQTGIEFPLKVNFHFKKFAVLNQFILYFYLYLYYTHCKFHFFFTMITRLMRNLDTVITDFSFF